MLPNNFPDITNLEISLRNGMEISLESVLHRSASSETRERSKILRKVKLNNCSSICDTTQIIWGIGKYMVLEQYSMVSGCTRNFICLVLFSAWRWCWRVSSFYLINTWVLKKCHSKRISSDDPECMEKFILLNESEKQQQTCPGCSIQLPWGIYTEKPHKA